MGTAVDGDLLQTAVLVVVKPALDSVFYMGFRV